MRFYSKSQSKTALATASVTLNSFLDKKLSPGNSGYGKSKLALPSLKEIEFLLTLHPDYYKKIINLTIHLILLAETYPIYAPIILERTVRNPDEFNRIIKNVSDLIDFIKSFQNKPINIDIIMAQADPKLITSEKDAKLLSSFADTLSRKHGEDAVKSIRAFIATAEEKLALKPKSPVTPKETGLTFRQFPVEDRHYSSPFFEYLHRHGATESNSVVPMA